ncbi:hypothetical protein WA026_007035 [Henosepilachna vigintioctopunctata]|uniref:Telomerase-binding protein EST1A n=1 Tax=Henosepilachna vigintioctopunctata TaxID=420089 RepID=A0AAW1VA92_9CUCU
MKRRPHQQYYKPGSGILRKSSSGIEESESDTNLLFTSKQNNIKISTNVESKFKSEGNSPRNNQQNMDKIVEKFGDVNITDHNKKSKKPDQEIYVPRHVANSKKFEQDTSRTVTQKRDDYSHEYEVIGDNEKNLHGYSNGNDRRFDSQSGERFNSNKSKRYSNKRRGNDSREEWSDKSRQVRQGSEPRGINNSNREANNWQRTRDTRSVEPSGPSSSGSASNYGEKPYTNKPPSGRRHSTICLERLNELPPRFRKKMMEEGQFKNVNLPEEGWDGSSLTFQGTNTQSSGYSTMDSYHTNHGSYATLPNSHTHQNQGPVNQNIGYLTMPGRSRGRGRLMNYDQYDYSSVNRQIDTKSPCNSRPPTPPSYGSSLKENPGRPTSRPHTPSYNRRNDYNRSSDDKYHSLSRQTSQERYRRTTYGDGYESRRSDDHFSYKNNEERVRNNEDRFSNNDERLRNDDRYRNNDDRHRNNDDRHRSNDDRHRNNNDRHRNNDDRLRNNDDRHKNNEERHRNNEHRYRNKDDFHQKRRDDPRSFRIHDDRDHKGQGEPRTGNYREHRDQFGSNDAQEVTVDTKLLISLKDDTEQKSKRSSLDALLSPVSPPTSIAETFEALLPVTTDVLDWSEEVEMNYKLESEAQSDALTRSSSVASLVESNATLVPSHSNVNNVNTNLVKKSKRTKRKTKLKGRSRSGRRNGSRERQFDSHTFDNFKVPAEPRHRKLSDRRDSSRSSRAHSREGSFDRTWRMSANDHENWRDEIRQRQDQDKGREITRSRQNSEDSQSNQRISGDLSNIDVKKAGVLVIQHPKPQENASGATPPSLDHPRYADARRQPSGCRTKSLFDPNNPDKPIIVKSSNARTDPGIPEIKEMVPLPADYDQFGNICPLWYREGSEEYRLSHYPAMINDVKRADQEIQCAIHSGIFLKNWTDVEIFRQFLRESLQYFLCKDLKFSQTGNIEQHFWKLLYYNIIERIRGAIQKDEANREHYKQFVLFLVDEGTQYFEGLLNMLEETYEFQLNDYLGANQSVPQKGLGYVGLALISAQKIFIFLGDLARYKEQINETTNYGKCRHWYIKAHEINPKNGRPYKKLAVLAVFARRKLDAVYYYMRSLMSSNPIYPARDKLNALFYENSKKYEQGEKRRREEKLERARKHMMEKESQTTNQPTSIRRETWIRPDGGKRVHRTTQAVQGDEDSEEQNLASLSSVEVNKRFVISYLHVHGKLITRIGMESFQEAAMQMLKEFRALLQHSPLPLPTNRLLQLLALNMFAIESTQLKGNAVFRFLGNDRPVSYIVNSNLRPKVPVNHAGQMLSFRRGRGAKISEFPNRRNLFIASLGRPI